jgi:general secretion pathway protein A
VAFRYKLEPFTAESTEAYVKHRLRLAGSPRLPFNSEALLAIHQASGGTPRVINTLCDNALFEAFLSRQETIGEDLIRRVADNLGLVGSALPAAPGAPAKPAPTPSSRPAGSKIDLAEIDRYLEGLGKL